MDYEVVSKGAKSDGTFWIKLRKETKDGFIMQAFLTVNEKLHDAAVVDTVMTVPKDIADGLKWTF